MRKKSGFTIVEQAIAHVPGFENVVRKLEQQVALRGQSQSTLQNYIRRKINKLSVNTPEFQSPMLLKTTMSHRKFKPPDSQNQ